MSTLLHHRSFRSLWVSQFLSALNDNIFRYALNTALVFHLIQTSDHMGKIWASLSAGIFILPYLMLSSWAGFMADRYAKSQLLQWSRFAEIGVFGFAGVALWQGNLIFLLVALLCIGSMAALYGPVKHAIAPEFLPAHHLNAANGAIEGSTYIAILLGSIVGSAVVTVAHGLTYAIVLMLVIAIVAWISSLSMPRTSAAAPMLRHGVNTINQLFSLLKWGVADHNRTYLLFAHAWFWFTGAAILAQIPIFVKESLQGPPIISTWLLGIFGLGITTGAWLCQHLTRGKITSRFIMPAAVTMSLSCLGLALTVWIIPPTPFATLNLFLHSKQGIIVSVLLFTLAASGGLYVVPLVSLLQMSVDATQRARLLAVANIWFAVFVIAASIMCSVILATGGTSKTIFAVVGALTWIVIWFTARRNIIIESRHFVQNSP